MNSIDVKAEVASYLRFVRQYPLVCVEQMNQDVIAVDRRRRMIWVEVKVSIGDLLRDRKKTFHQMMRHKRGLPLWEGARHVVTVSGWFCPVRFYFAIPGELVEKAKPKIEEMFPWAGLFSVGATRGRFFGHRVTCARNAEQIHDEQLEVKRVESLIKCQSASLANIYAKYSRIQRRSKDGDVHHPQER